MAGQSRRQRYNILLRRHFLPEEARALSRARSLKYIEIRRMTASRQLLYNRFARRTGLVHGDKRFPEAYTDYIRQWYLKRDLTTFNVHMQRTISPWDWFDRVSYRLPEEDRYTARSRRRNKRDSTARETASQRAHRIRWINDLKAEIRRHPRRAAQLITQIKRLGGRVDAETMRKAGLSTTVS